MADHQTQPISVDTEIDTGAHWRDSKRYYWPLPVLLSAIPLVAWWLYARTGNEWTLWLSPLFFYVLIPMIEMLVGEDRSNPPREAIPYLRDDPFYRWSAFAALPASYIVWAVGAWYVAVMDAQYSA